VVVKLPGDELLMPFQLLADEKDVVDDEIRRASTGGWETAVLPTDLRTWLQAKAPAAAGG
jgi:hypothetical protein